MCGGGAVCVAVTERRNGIADKTGRGGGSDLPRELDGRGWAFATGGCEVGDGVGFGVECELPAVVPGETPSLDMVGIGCCCR